MKRRDFIVQTAKNFGYTVCGTSVAQLLSGCSKDQANTSTGAATAILPEHTHAVTFNALDKQTLMTIADIIIPKTETPSASGVGAIEFIIKFFEQVFNTKQQADFLAGLESIKDSIFKKNKKSFVELSLDEQTHYVRQLDLSTFNSTSTHSPAQVFYKHFKRLTVLGYYQSELVGETLLNYDPIPAKFIGCMPYDGRVMSLN